MKALKRALNKSSNKKIWYATGEIIQQVGINLYDATDISIYDLTFQMFQFNKFIFRQVHDVPYRLLDSSPKTQQKHQESRQQHSRGDFDFRKSSHRDDGIEILSKSAPQSSHPLQSDSEHSLSPKFSDDITMCDVQRTISLTSENPSEAFFSADEDIHASRSSSLKTTDGNLPLGAPKKRYASDLSIVGPDAGGRLSSHRSDYEIHTPEHRLPTRPQSTAELVSVVLVPLQMRSMLPFCDRILS